MKVGLIARDESRRTRIPLMGRNYTRGQTCIIGDCEKPQVSLRLCGMHYARLRKRGTTDRYDWSLPAEERFNRLIAIDAETGCWLWTGALTKKSYGMFWPGGDGPKMQSVHRWSYLHFVGAIPDGMQVDHACHNRDATCLGGNVCRHRRCANPAHLELATNSENQIRAHARHDQTACANGHPFTDETLYIYPSGKRGCRVCRRIHQAAYRARKESPRLCASA